MSTAVSILIPSLEDRKLLEACLPPLLQEVAARDLGDEILIIDDSGAANLEPWLQERFPSVDCISNARNLGFGQALLAGAQSARHELIFCLNPDVILRPGCLGPLIERMAEADVFAVAPLVLLDGERTVAESLSALEWREGFPVLEVGREQLQPSSEGGEESKGLAVCFTLGGASLLRRADFLSAGGFDPLYEPFYWEDVDHCWSAWRRGLRVLVEPRAVVEHFHRGTIGARIPNDLVRAAIEKNRLLFTWKFLDEEETTAQHLRGLEERLLSSAVLDDRESLIWFLTALDQLGELEESCRALPTATRSFSEIRRLARPGSLD